MSDGPDGLPVDPALAKAMMQEIHEIQERDRARGRSRRGARVAREAALRLQRSSRRASHSMARLRDSIGDLAAMARFGEAAAARAGRLSRSAGRRTAVRARQRRAARHARVQARR